jgi:hypothetical protein
MDNLTVYQGLDADFTVTLRDSDDAAITGTYDGTEPLSLALWDGDDRAPLALAASTAAWLVPADGTLTLHLDRADSAAWAPGRYRGLVSLTDGPDVVPAFAFVLVVEATAGAAAALPVYGSAQDLRRFCPWIDEIQSPNDQAGFAEQRAEAREWLDDILLVNDRGGGVALYQGSYRGGAGNLAVRSGIRNPWLVEQLAADRLVLTARLRRAVSYYALGLILTPKLGSRDKTSFQQLGRLFHAQAEEELVGLTAELDTDGDGTSDYAIDLSTVPRIRG